MQTPDTLSMNNRHVLLTGGAGGLGMGVTPAVLRRGAASVTIPYRQHYEVERLKGILSPAERSRVHFVELDLTDEVGIATLVDEMERVDVLIHLVGGFSMQPVHELSLDDWQQSFAINLTTTFLTCKHCLRRMRQKGYGRIVTISSRGAVQPSAQQAAYSAAKAGVVALTQVIAQETKGMDITANVVLPGTIDTPGNREAMGVTNADQWIKPESLAETICFLASEAARDLRGAAVPIYGNG